MGTILDNAPEHKGGSYKAEVEVAGEPGRWHSNGIRLATRGEGEAYAADLARRWQLVVRHRAAESPDPATHSFGDGVLARVAPVT